MYNIYICLSLTICVNLFSPRHVKKNCNATKCNHFCIASVISICLVLRKSPGWILRLQIFNGKDFSTYVVYPY